MSAATKNIFIVAAKRTPFGTFGGKLKGLSATELGVISSRAALAAGNVNPALVDEVFFGNVIQSSLDAAYLSRHIGLKAGVPQDKPALTLNRLCGSGFEAAIQGAESIILGRANVTLCGGTESMSQCPLTASGNARWGIQYGKGLKLEDTLAAGLTDSHVNLPMGITAENLAVKYNITRQQCDEYGARSQHTWKAANAAGIFKAEITPVQLHGRKGPEHFETDEHPRGDVSLAEMAKLKPVFKEHGTVTAGNASGICDGSASLIVASEEAVNKHGLTPLARIVGWHRSGCDPSIMGIGPVSAIQGALHATRLSLAQMDLVEINEAFAAQYLACEKALGLDPHKSNVNGGAIALGHPLAASGARILAHLAHAINRNAAKYAVGSACIGGGQGIAVILAKP